MGEITKIAWTQHSQNFWTGCRKVSPGCKSCYMFRDMVRYGRDPSEVRRTKTWGQPYKWQKKAQAAGVKEMVFTCSWSDFFIEEADDWRAEAWEIIKNCPNLIFQILTKRPELIKARLPEDWDDGYDNVALGVSVENSKYLHRLDTLRQVPAKVHFLSAEPLLGPLTGLDLSHVEWAIVGGESGPDYRIMEVPWVREIRGTCKAAGVPFFFKQHSGARPGENNILDGQTWQQWPDEWLF